LTTPDAIHAVGFPLWKRGHVRTFLAPAEVRFVASARRVPPAAKAAIWGMRIPARNFPPRITVLRLEDGFLRSVGLGADLTTPLSWVVDQRGIYYDATTPSDLEDLLATHLFTSDEKDRGRKLRASIFAAGLTKYNVGTGTWRRPSGAPRVILVPGQVESDASIRLGTNRIATNLDLLRTVRESEPDAHLVYRPHPDVTAGLRRRGRGEIETTRWCDEVADVCPMHALLREVDEVHTMTSLAGLEALLRDKKVVTYGMPFYAGWGLTEDRDMTAATAQRRGRRLELDELVYAALALYPRYADRHGRRLSGPEQALDELASWQRAQPARPSPWRPVLRLLRH